MSVLGFFEFFAPKFEAGLESSPREGSTDVIQIQSAMRMWPAAVLHNKQQQSVIDFRIRHLRHVLDMSLLADGIELTFGLGLTVGLTQQKL